MNNKKMCRVLGLFILGVLAFSFVAGIASATLWPYAPGKAEAQLSPVGSILNFIGENIYFTEGSPQAAILGKVLLTLLVIFLVYGIIEGVLLDFLLGEHEWIKWAVAIIIGVLSFLYSPVEVIKSISATYEAAAVAFSVILPLVIILAFNIKLKEKKEFLPEFIGNGVLIIFTVYLLYRAFQLYLTNQIGTMMGIGLLIAAGIAIFWYFANEKIMKYWDELKAKRAAHGAVASSEEQEKLKSERRVNTYMNYLSKLTESNDPKLKNKGTMQLDSFRRYLTSHDYVETNKYFAAILNEYHSASGSS